MSIKPTLAEEFDQLAEEYTDKIRRWVPHYDHLVRHAASIHVEASSPKILDVGAGNGNVSMTILERCSPHSITLLDASEDMLRLASARLSPSVEVFNVKSFFQEARFESCQFDFICCSLALHHLVVDDKRSFLMRAHDWLRPSGQITIADLIIDKQDSDHYRLLEEWEAYAKMKGTTEDEWKHVMEHYEAYDRPDNLSTHWQILQDLGYVKLRVLFKQSKWMVLSAKKPS